MKRLTLIRNLMFTVLIIMVVFLLIVGHGHAAGYKSTKDELFLHPQYGIWLTLYYNDDMGSVQKYVYISNEDGLSLFFTSYQDEEDQFVTIGLRHTTEAFIRKVGPPKYKSALCCWSDVEHSGGEMGLGLENNAWVWQLNKPHNSLTIDTKIVEDVLENNKVHFRFNTTRGRKETTFEFKEGQDETLRKLIQWLLKKED